MNVTHYTHSVECEGLSVQYDLCCPGKSGTAKFACEDFTIDDDSSYEEKVATFEKLYGETLGEIERLTNNADGIDYTVAVASGIVAGIIDLVWVGEFSIDRADKWGNEKVENFVIWIAQRQGYTGKDLAGAVAYLETKFSIAADKVTNDFGGGIQHHLRDFSHHPTPVGLFFSLLTQFTGNVYGTDVAGIFKVAPLRADDFTLIGKTLPEKITFGVINWSFHMISDMAGSSGSVKDGKLGTGLPGPIVSLLKELSALPIFRGINKKGYKEFSVWVSKLFNGTLLAKRDSQGKIIEAVKFDLRTEIGVAYELGRQTIPVIINECVVRAFYFLRRLSNELKANHVRNIAELQKINWKNTLPAKNRTIVRMLTISTGTMEVIDLVDAGIRSGGALPVFVLRVNFVGVGRFAVAGSIDMMMGMKKSRLELAMASAEVAKTAQVTRSIMEDVEQRGMQTQDKLDQLTHKINGESLVRDDDIRRGFSMGYSINDIEIDTNKFTLEEVKEGAEQIFSLKSEEFQRIKNAPWYQRFLKAVTFRANGKKVIVSDIISLGKLQQLFLRVYAQHYARLDAQLDQFMATLDRVDTKVERMRSGLELQDDMQIINQDNAAILQLLLSEYDSKNGKEEEFQRYRRTVIKAFGNETPKGIFNTSMLGNNLGCHKRFCQCLYELAAIDGCLENEDFPSKIQNILHHLAVAESDKQDIKQTVLRQVSSLGIEYLTEQYQPSSFDWTGFELEEYQESTDSRTEDDPLATDKSQEEAVTSATAEGISPYPEIEECIKRYIHQAESPLGTPQDVRENISIVCAIENMPDLKTVVGITAARKKSKKEYLVFTTYAMYYLTEIKGNRASHVSQIIYEQISPKDMVISTVNGTPTLCYKQFELPDVEFNVEVLREFLVAASQIENKPCSDQTSPLASQSVETRIGYFRIVALLASKAGYPLYEAYRLAVINNQAEYWKTISAGLQTALPEEEIHMWEQTIPYPNGEYLHEDLLRKVCLAQIRTKENMGVSLEDERYYSLIISDPKRIRSIKLAAITSEENMYRCIDGSDNGPIWTRYETIKERVSTYDKAIEVAKQAGETEIQKSLENALDRLKKKAHFTMPDESKQRQIERLIREYLSADELYCRCIESLDISAIRSALYEMIPVRILVHTGYISALDIAQELGIIGIYAPRIRDTGFNKPTSGILFAKDAIYLKWGRAKPECIPYSLISGIKTGLKSVSFTLKGNYTDKKLAESGFVFGCFSASADQKLLQLFSDICKLY